MKWDRPKFDASEQQQRLRKTFHRLVKRVERLTGQWWDEGVLSDKAPLSGPLLNAVWKTLQTVRVSDFSEVVRGWLADVALMTRGTRERTKVLCYAYNWASNPAAFRTDRESRVCRKLAARWRREIDGLTGWHETDSGRLWI